MRISHAPSVAIPKLLYVKKIVRDEKACCDSLNQTKLNGWQTGSALRSRLLFSHSSGSQRHTVLGQLWRMSGTSTGNGPSAPLFFFVCFSSSTAVCPTWSDQNKGFVSIFFWGVSPAVLVLTLWWAGPHHASSPSRLTLADRNEWMMNTRVFGQQWRSSCWCEEKEKRQITYLDINKTTYKEV